MNSLNWADWAILICVGGMAWGAVMIGRLTLAPLSKQASSTLRMLFGNPVKWREPSLRPAQARSDAAANSDIPRAYKWTWALRPSNASGPRFVSLHTPLDWSVAYPSDAQAVCRVDADHHAPDPDCGCGFYGLKRSQDLGLVEGSKPYCTTLAAAALMILEVEFSGRVIPAEHGYRAEHQRVLRVHCQNRCVQCWGYRRRAVGFTWVTAVLGYWKPNPVVEADVLAPACRRHADPTLTPADVAGLLCTEVRWTTPRHQAHSWKVS